MASSRDGFVEVVACNADDIKDGEMKEVEVEGKKLLIVRTNGSFHAVSPKCTHYGAPLSKGALCNGRIRCPWHGACFDVRTGDIEDFPGIDNLQTFQVTVVSNQVKVRVKRSEMKTDKRALVAFKKINKDKRVFLIIGGGGAGMMCAVTLRQQGFQGTIIIATKEKHLPYDRPKLSKDLKATPDNLCLRSKMDYASSDIQIQTGKEVQEINFTKKFVTFKDGKNTTYDSVLVATGGSPNTLDIPGKNLRNIFVLRSVDDGNLISSSIRETTKVVIIGSSFIGLEVAAYLAGKVASLTVVGRGSVPLSAVLGKDVGLVFQKILESKGVNFIFNNGPKKFLGKDEKLCGVVLEDGANIDADVCVLGVGVRPTTDFLKDSGIEMSPDNYILVNKSMQTNIKDVYAAGDIVRFPLFLSDDKQVNIQHWQMANQHGRIAGMNMAGKSTEIHSVPFFWTMIAGKSLRYAGYGHGYTDIVLHGDSGSEKFVSFYIKDEQVVAAASMNFDPIVAQVAEMLHNRKRITKAEVVSNPTDFWTLHR